MNNLEKEIKNLIDSKNLTSSEVANVLNNVAEDYKGVMPFIKASENCVKSYKQSCGENNKYLPISRLDIEALRKQANEIDKNITDKDIEDFYENF